MSKLRFKQVDAQLDEAIKQIKDVIMGINENDDLTTDEKRMLLESIEGIGEDLETDVEEELQLLEQEQE